MSGQKVCAHPHERVMSYTCRQVPAAGNGIDVISPQERSGTNLRGLCRQRQNARQNAQRRTDDVCFCFFCCQHIYKFINVHTNLYLSLTHAQRPGRVFFCCGYQYIYIHRCIFVTTHSCILPHAYNCEQIRCFMYPDFQKSKTAKNVVFVLDA